MKWLAERCSSFESSGIRKVFDLGAKLKDPINLSIGQPDFEMPPEAKKAAIEAINAGKSGYTPSQGLEAFRQDLRERMRKEYDLPGNENNDLFLTSGTSGGLLLFALTTVNPGDEVIIPDPFFAMYAAVVKMLGGKPVFVDTYPDLIVDVQKIADAITPKTKAIIFNSPVNPTGVVLPRQTVKDVALLAKERGILLVSDEIYNRFCYLEFASPAEYNPDTLVLNGFSKTYGMPGWRVGYAYGPKALIEEMIKFQQYTFVCSPQAGQWAASASLQADMSGEIENYKRKRDTLYDGISDLYDVVKPEGAFYMFPKVPDSRTGTQFVTDAIEKHQMLIIPGNVFSARDTHFRISYAASDKTIERGIEALRKLAGK